MLSCSRLYSACDKYHKINKRFRHFRYTRIAGGDEPEASDADSDSDPDANKVIITNVIELLLYIAREPLAAQFIESADFRKDSFGDEHQWDFDDVPEGDIEILCQMVEQSPYLACKDDVQQTWKSGLRGRRLRIADALLVTFLPNIKHWTPTQRFNWASCNLSSSDQDKDDTIEGLLVKWANDPEQSNASLSKLEVIRPFLDDDHEIRTWLESMAWALKIQSLREFHVSSLVAIDNEDGFEPPNTNFSENLEVISLPFSAMGAATGLKVLSRVPNLKTFRLGMTVKRYGAGMFTDSGHIMAMLELCVGAHLEQLTLTAAPEQLSTYVSMSGFKRLRVLEVDLQVFLGGEFEPHDDWLESDDVEAMKDVPVLPAFVDMFPASMETVKMYRECMDKTDISRVCTMLDRFAAEKNTKLPLLKDFTLFFSIDPELEPSELSAITALLEQASAAGLASVQQDGLMEPSFPFIYDDPIHGRRPI